MAEHLLEFFILQEMPSVALLLVYPTYGHIWLFCL
mgnify:CR=1 FL=1